MNDAVRKAQEASANIARKTTEGHVASALDSESRRGTTLDPVAVGLDNVSCSPSHCDPGEGPGNRFHDENFEECDVPSDKLRMDECWPDQ